MTKKVLITQSNYIPWKGYFDLINMADVFVVYDEMQYTKRDWRNRNKFKTPKGLQWLSIPVQVKGKYFQKINEVKVSDPDWNLKHWAKISQLFRKAPHFKTFGPRIKTLYEQVNSELLTDINQYFIRHLCDWLDIQTNMERCTNFKLDGEKSEKLLNICLELEATHYITGPAARNYLDEEMFNNKGVEVIWMDYSGYPEYPQLHGEFEHGVSIIDLFFNTGEDARKYLKTTNS